MRNDCFMTFEHLASDGRARRGRLTFPRGTVETPAFMPVGTYGTVKGMTPAMVEAIGAEIILGNTFHLWLRPGTEVVAAHDWSITVEESPDGGGQFTIDGVRTAVYDESFESADEA